MENKSLGLNGTSSKSLKADVIGLVGAATLGLVMLSPAMTIYGNFGPAFLESGKATPLVYFFALLATLPTAMSYGLLSRSFPSSGSAATWIAQTPWQKFAKWVGWMVFFYYVTNFIIQPITLGVFLNDMVHHFGGGTYRGTFVIGVLICLGFPAWMAYRGISPSVHGALLFLLFETAVVTALCLTVLWSAPAQGIHLSLEGFHVSGSPTGMTGILRAMIFGMLSFCGFDVITTLSEETKMPKKLVPQAIVISLGLFGALMIFGTWLLTYAAPADVLKKFADAGGMPVSEIANILWGKGSVLVSITAISAALGVAIATAVGSSRVLYSMASRKDAPSWFAVLHPRYQVPWNAMHLIFGLGLVCTLGTAKFLEPFQTYVWWGTTSTFFAMLTYLAVNFANLILFKERVFESPWLFLLHGVVPLMGIAIDGYILVESFFIELWKQGWATGQSVIVFDLACAVLGVGLVISPTLKRSDRDSNKLNKFNK